MDENKYSKDPHGYLRFKTGKKRLLHRYKAFKEIYQKNKDKYPLRFKNYQVHHKDGDKLNNRIENLELMPLREHEARHGYEKKEMALVRLMTIFFFGALVYAMFIGILVKFKLGNLVLWIGTIIIIMICILISNIIEKLNKKKKV